jgi:hypothetical protein
MLNKHRTVFHASPTIGAIPDYFGSNHIIKQALLHGIYCFFGFFGHGYHLRFIMVRILGSNQIWSFGVQMFFHMLYKSNFGIQMFSSIISRAILLAPSAAYTGI